ncbi:MAG: DinB family protein [Acidobacteriota bacterium]
MDDQKPLREHLLELLEGKSAHIGLEDAIKDFPLEHINSRVENSPHTGWDLLEHIRIAQWDILEFSLNAKHKSPKWPDGYWPKKEATRAEWKASVKQILKDLKAFKKLVANKKTDLYSSIPHGDGQTILRELLLIADHNAYHLGQLVLLKKMLEVA